MDIKSALATLDDEIAVAEQQLAAEVAEDEAAEDFLLRAWKVSEAREIYRELGMRDERRACERWLKGVGLTRAKIRKLKPTQPTLF